MSAEIAIAKGTDDRRNHQRSGIKRHPVVMMSECAMVVLSCKDLTVTDHVARIVDLSATGMGVLSERPIDPGIIVFKERTCGYKCGFLIWCRPHGSVYRAGIQFVALPREDEEHLQQQVARLQRNERLRDPDRIVSTLIDYLENKPGSI